MSPPAPDAKWIDDACAANPTVVATALQAAAPCRGELGPVLCARLLQAAVEPNRWTHNPSPVFLPYLAAAWKLTEAHPLIVALLRLPPDQCEAVLDDFITDGASRTLADTWPGDLRAIEALIFDAKADPYARGAGLDAAALLTHRGTLPRAGMIDLATRAAALPTDPDDENDVTFATMLTGSIYALRLWELRGTVAALFDRELVDPCYLGDRDEVLALLPDGAVPSPDDHEFPPPINDAWETVRGWHYFSPSYAAEEVETNDEFIPVPARLDPQPHRAPPKIGRNDPCPCGSGKKYKKCCGA